MPNPIAPEIQAASDAMMKLRYVALELKEAAIEAQNKMLVAQNYMMDKPGSKVMAMELGSSEAAYFGFMAQPGLVKGLHKDLNDFARKHNEPVPLAPQYDEEYIALAAKSMPIKLSNHPRR